MITFHLRQENQSKTRKPLRTIITNYYRNINHKGIEYKIRKNNNSFNINFLIFQPLNIIPKIFLVAQIMKQNNY